MNDNDKGKLPPGKKPDGGSSGLSDETAAQAEKNSIKKLLTIFFVTLRIGTFTIGGGYAMIPMMQRDFVERHKWIDNKDIVDLFAVSQSLPGIIAVNSSMLVGYKLAGYSGALAAAFGSVLPSFVILVIVTIFYNSFITNPYVLGALRGIIGAVAALLVSTVFTLRKNSVTDWIGAVLFAVALALSLFTGINVVFIILGGAAAGILIKLPGIIKVGKEVR